MFVITLGPVAPGHKHRSRRNLGNDLRMFREDIRPDHRVPSVLADEARNVLELPQVYLAGSQAFRFRLGEPFELPSLIHPNVNESARKQRSEEHTSELQSLAYLVCRLLLEKKKKRME